MYRRLLRDIAHIGRYMWELCIEFKLPRKYMVCISLRRLSRNSNSAHTFGVGLFYVFFFKSDIKRMGVISL